MVRAALIVITENWKYLKYPSMDQQMKGSTYTQMEYHSATQRNELLRHVTNGWNSNALGWMAKARLKWLPDGWIHLVWRSTKGKTIGRGADQQLPEIGVKEGVNIKGAAQEILG